MGRFHFLGLEGNGKMDARIGMKAFLPRTVVILGLVSFLNDTASEMITPSNHYMLEASTQP